MKFCAEGTTLNTLDELGPGVLGYAIKEGNTVHIPLIEAVRPGNGDVGRFLDTLPREWEVRIPNVISRKLEGMLLRRGFAPEDELVLSVGEYMTVYVRRPASASADVQPPGAAP